MSKHLGNIILVVACIGLAAALIVIRNQEQEARTHNVHVVLDLSNSLTVAQNQVTNLNQVNLALSNNLSASQETSSTLSNQLTDAQAELTETKSVLVKTELQVTNLNDEVAVLDARRKDLERRTAELDRQRITLDKQIALTEVTLSQSRTNNLSLETELKKQVADRSVLERRFNDLSEVRAQLRKLKDNPFLPPSTLVK
jgi:chromosome segregation ATPase